jgi:magnesium transporter
VTTIVLFQGLKSSVTQILTLVLGFLVICVGITVLQMSKVDPAQLTKLDRRSTILLQAARAKTEGVEMAEEKSELSGMEDPGMDTLRGSFGTVGSIIRARSAKRMSMRNADGRPGQRQWGSGRVGGPNGMRVDTHATGYDPNGAPISYLAGIPTPNPEVSTMDRLNGVKRHQLYDAPVPMQRQTTGSFSGRGADEEASSTVGNVGGQSGMAKKPTIKFGDQDLVHQYHPPGKGGRGERTDSNAVHDYRKSHGPGGMPPVPSLPSFDSAADGYPPSRQRTLTDATPTVSKLLAEQERERSISFPEHLVPRTEMTGETASAPPSMSPRFLNKNGGRVNAREVFPNDSPTELSASSSTGNLLVGFPSGESIQAELMAAQQDDLTRGRKTKKYPKGDETDDREESVSLWQRGGDADSDSSHPEGGIRLVTTGVGNRF